MNLRVLIFIIHFAITVVVSVGAKYLATLPLKNYLGT